VATGRTVPPGAPGRLGKLFGAVKVCTLYPLYDKLRDSVTARDGGDRCRIVIDQHDHDLAAVSGVDRTRCVQDGDPEAGGESGPWVDQADVAVREFDRDPGRDERPATARSDLDIGGGVQVGAGVTGMSVERHRKVGVELPYGDPQLLFTHCFLLADIPHDRANERHRIVAYPRRVAQLPPTAYAERLTVPWWAWPVGIALAAFAAAEIFLGANPQCNWIPYAILIPLVVVGLWRLGGVVIRVDGTELHVDDAHIPVSFITEVNMLDAEAKRQLLGPLAAPHVFAIQRPWIKAAVRVVIDDPADPTPYWVISTRRPAQLAEAIIAARS
jgi:hypothetical protein